MGVGEPVPGTCMSHRQLARACSGSARRPGAGFEVWEHGVQPESCLSQCPAAGWGLCAPFSKPVGPPSVLPCGVLKARSAHPSTGPCHPHSIMCLTTLPPNTHLITPLVGQGCTTCLSWCWEPGCWGVRKQVGQGSPVPEPLRPPSQSRALLAGKLRLGEARACLERQAKTGLACCREGACACSYPKAGALVATDLFSPVPKSMSLETPGCPLWAPDLCPLPSFREPCTWGTQGTQTGSPSHPLAPSAGLSCGFPCALAFPSTLLPTPGALVQ